MAAALFADDIADALRLERQLARELQTLRYLVVEAGRQVAAADNPRQALRLAARRRLVPRSVRRRVARLIGELVRQGVADAEREMDRRRRRKRGFAVQSIPGGLELPKVDDAEVDLYHRVASVIVDQLEAEQFGLVREAVEAGLRAGETDEAIGARIDQLDTGLARAHADTWARTESTRYYTLGRSAAIEAADDVWGYEYVVIVDNRTTAICRAFVGKRVSKAAMRKFPPFHYGCRTTVAAVFFDEAPEVEDELGEDAVPAEGFGVDPREVIPDLASPSLGDLFPRRGRSGSVLPPRLTRTDDPFHRPTYELPRSLSEEVDRRVRHAEQALLVQPSEHALVFDKAGNTIQTFRGDKETVGLREGFDYTDLVASHNHPEGFGLSHHDLATAALRNFLEIRVVDPVFKVRYRLQRPDDGWPGWTRDEWRDIYRSAEGQVKLWSTRSSDPELTAELDIHAAHYAMELIAERARLRYVREPL